jgi:hypothetical protein
MIVDRGTMWFGDVTHALFALGAVVPLSIIARTAGVHSARNTGCGAWISGCASVVQNDQRTLN